jgi:hypothetical protein
MKKRAFKQWLKKPQEMRITIDPAYGKDTHTELKKPQEMRITIDPAYGKDTHTEVVWGLEDGKPVIKHITLAGEAVNDQDKE